MGKPYYTPNTLTSPTPNGGWVKDGISAEDFLNGAPPPSAEDGATLLTEAYLSALFTER